MQFSAVRQNIVRLLVPRCCIIDTMPEIKCDYCRKLFFKSQSRINENKKFGHNFYCSGKCLALNRYRRKAVVCKNCGKKFERCLSDISINNYCSLSCSATVNNKKFPKRGPGFKICKICTKRFFGNNLYCSKVCYQKSRVCNKPNDLIKSLKEIYSKLGRVPAKREISEFARACIYAFGSWNNAVRAAGLKPNRSHENRMYKRLMTKAKDGHLCDSISEAIIDNWLNEHNIFHDRNVKYPTTNHRADWVIANAVFIEYFGLAEDSFRYDRAIRVKKELCKQHKIRLIEIYARDLYPKNNLENKLRFLLVKDKLNF